MSLIRTSHSKEKPYVVLHKKTLEITSLSWEAKGLWAYLLSRHDDWTIKVSQLTENFPAKKDKIFKLLKELNTNGLCERNDIRVKGKFTHTEYTIYEEPTIVVPYPQKPHKKKPLPKEPQRQKPLPAKLPCPVLPLTDLPLPVKPTLLSNEYIKERKEIHTCSVSEKIANHLHKSILSWKVKLNKMSTIEAWAYDLEKLIRIDGYNETEIMAVIDWLPTNEFWRKNILSAHKFRDKFERLDADMKSEKKGKRDPYLDKFMEGVRS